MVNSPSTSWCAEMISYPHCPMQERPDLLRDAALSELDQDYPLLEVVVMDGWWPLAPIGRQRLARCYPMLAAKR
jgi:hypothetical protein